MNESGYALLWIMLIGFVLLIVALTRPSRPSRSVDPPPHNPLNGARLAPRPASSGPGAGTWLLIWGGSSVFASMWYLSSTAGGGCDGGLCILRYFLLPPIWLGVGVVVWVVKLLAQRTDNQ
jgi:hypothetical protein